MALWNAGYTGFRCHRQVRGQSRIIVWSKSLDEDLGAAVRFLNLLLPEHEVDGARVIVWYETLVTDSV